MALRDPSRRVEGAEALERVRFDFHAPSGFAGALRGVDRVFLLLPPQFANIRRDFEPFLLAVLQAEVERVVFLSVRGAENNPLLPHRRMEKLLERSGLARTHLRPAAKSGRPRGRGARASWTRATSPKRSRRS